MTWSSLDSIIHYLAVKLQFKFSSTIKNTLK